MRLRVTAPENFGTDDIENSTEGAAVYKVPPYWYTGCEHGPTVFCPVERGRLAIAIFVRNKGLDEVELDLGPETKLFPAETAKLWVVTNATEAAALRELWSEGSGRDPETTPNDPDPREGGGGASSMLEQVSSQRGGRAPQTRNFRNIRQAAQHSDGAEPVREALHLELTLPVTAPAIVAGDVKAWVKQHAPTLREWVAKALIGTGLPRHVPTTELKLAADQVFDSFLASTKGLTLELIAALRRYATYVYIHVYTYYILTLAERGGTVVGTLCCRKSCSIATRCGAL